LAEDLTTEDLAAYTKGRLAADDPETQRALDAALARVRGHCYWHVSPVRTDTLTVRGGGFSDITLPTLNVVEVISITEDGYALDLDSVTIWRNTLTKKSGCWRGIVDVTLEHGYTAAEAADWRAVVLEIAAQDALNAGEYGSGPVVHFEVDDVVTKWQGGTFEDLYGARLRPYRRTWWAA
jgi:hypothetical protein